jgi:hypothetical protein
MGVGITLMLNKQVRDAKLRHTDGKTLFDCASTLDEIGKSNHIAPAFSTFIFDPESMDEPPEGELLEETYYDPKDGLRVIVGLIAAIEAADGQARKKVEKGGGVLYPLAKVLGVKSGMEGKWVEYCLADLKELERCLKLAIKAKAGFCLLAC